MKKIDIFLILIIIFASSYSQKTQASKKKFNYSILVTKNGIPQPNTAVMCIFSTTEESLIKCDATGTAVVSTDKPILLLAAIAPKSCGIVQIKRVKKKNDVLITLKDAPKPDHKKPDGTIGVTEVDTAGNVIFQSPGVFLRFGCNSSLPWLGTMNDPNGWKTWTVPGWAYQSRLLIVPKRYRLFHAAVYGFPIDQALWAEYAD